MSRGVCSWPMRARLGGWGRGGGCGGCPAVAAGAALGRCAGAVVDGLCVRAELGDPQRPWWTVGALVALAALAITMAQRELRPALLYPAAVATNLAVTFLWASQYRVFAGHRVRDLVMANLLALAGAGLGVVMELQTFRPAMGERAGGQRLHASAAWIGVVTLLGVSLAQLGLGYRWAGSVDAMVVSGTAAVAVITLVVGCLWDRAGYGSAGVAVCGELRAAGDGAGPGRD